MNTKELADSLGGMEDSVRNIEGDDVADLSRILAITGMLADKANNAAVVLAMLMMEGQFIGVMKRKGMTDEQIESAHAWSVKMRNALARNT